MFPAGWVRVDTAPRDPLALAAEAIMWLGSSGPLLRVADDPTQRGDHNSEDSSPDLSRRMM
jgi:hypothetical protein